MKAPKAIEILTDLRNVELLHKALDTPDALKLGIEALKRLQSNRGTIYTVSDELLPGETPEEEAGSD